VKLEYGLKFTPWIENYLPNAVKLRIEWLKDWPAVLLISSRGQYHQGGDRALKLMKEKIGKLNYILFKNK
jgi:hypothetical protein